MKFEKKEITIEDELVVCLYECEQSGVFTGFDGSVHPFESLRITDFNDVELDGDAYVPDWTLGICVGGIAKIWVRDEFPTYEAAYQYALNLAQKKQIVFDSDAAAQFETPVTDFPD